MSTSRNELGALLLSLAIASAARGSGRDKSPILDLLSGKRSLPDEVRAAIVADAKAGRIAPTSPDCDCEFCKIIREHSPDASAGEPAAVCDAPEPPRGEKERVAETVPGILREAAETYEARNPLYGDAYKHYGATMMGFFPLGITIAEPEDWNRLGLFSMMVSKMHRIAANLSTGGHRDSSLDLAVYAAMMTELTEYK